MINRSNLVLTVLTIVTLLISYQGCSSENTTPQDEPPKIDLSTPDNAVKSLQNYVVWYDTSDLNTTKNFFNKVKAPLYSAFTKQAGDTLISRRQNFFNLRYTNAKKMFPIDNVDIQSDSRAVVTIKTDQMTYGFDHDKSLIFEKFILTNMIKIG